MSNIQDILELSKTIKELAGAGIDVSEMVTSLNAMMKEAATAGDRVEPKPIENGSAVMVYEQTPKEAAGEIDYYKFFSTGSVDCITEEKAFYDDNMYNTLYKGIKSATVQNQVKYQLEQKAKKLGGTALVKMFNQTCTAKKKEVKKEEKELAAAAERAEVERQRQQDAEAKKQRLEAGNLTKYTKLPEDCENMYIGEGWIADDDGIRKMEDNGKTIKIVEACMYPILIKKLFRPLDTAENSTRKIEVEYKSEDGWRDATIEREVLSNSNKAISLSNIGVGVTSENVKPFTTAMSSMLKESSKRGALKIVNTLNKLGWDKDFKHFLPYTDENFVFERHNEMPELMEALKPCGDREAWFSKFKEIRALNYAPFKLATAAIFASAVLPMLSKQDSFVVNLYGGSGYGKSAVLSIVTTIFSSMENGIFFDSDNTLASLELSADTFNNLPLILDDISKGDEKKKAAFQQTVMMLANGRGRNRATKDLKQRKKSTFKLTSLVSSEQNVTNSWTTNGSIYRVLSKNVTEYFPYIDKEKYPELENIEDVISVFQKNYGFAGKEFVEKLQELGQEEIIKRNNKNLERARKLAREHGKENRQATSIAIILTAEEIATEFLFQDGQSFTDEELLDVMVDPENADQYMRFYKTIIGRVLSNPSKIEGLTKPEDIRGEYWGIYNRDDKKKGEDKPFESISIFPVILESWAKELDLDLNLFYAEMRKRNILCADKGTSQTKTKSEKLGGRPRVVKLRIETLEPDEAQRPRNPDEEFYERASEAQKLVLKTQGITTYEDEKIPFE